MSQYSLFEADTKFTYQLGTDNWNPMEVSFRDIVPEIKNTTYLTHSIYYYPAKFIPHVVRFCINEFTTEGDWVIDPFAGSGTVGLEAYLTKRNAILLDLNPLLEHIIPLKIYTGDSCYTKNELYKTITQLQEEKNMFIPQYENIRYWYPDEIFNLLSRYWAGLHRLDENIYKWIIQASLVRISKQFSLAEHRTPKLFISKFKKQFISNLMQKNWQRELDTKLFEFSYKYFNAVRQLQHRTKNCNNKIFCYAGVDSSKFKLDVSKYQKLDTLITSPPYLQAQEYIRTSKLDLFWMGYSEQQIREISKLEIPYRETERIIETETLNKIRKNLHKASLIKILNSYFDHTIASLENTMKLLKKDGKACIFIGNPKIDGIEIETWKIFTEYFTDNGYNFEIVFDDKIKTRQLFGRRNNKNPNGMKSEYLLILSKK